MPSEPREAREEQRLRLVEGQGGGGDGRPGRIARASVWTVVSTVGMSGLRLVSQMVLSYLLLPSHFGVIAIMRTFLTFVEMVSDMGIRGAVLYHEKGEERSFLGTAFSVQFLRGVAMWLLTCAIAWPAATFYHEPILLVLLPIAGLESVNNGLLSVRTYVDERRMRVGMPTILEVLALCVSILTTITWAAIEPSVWALAAGPVVGGFVRAAFSHWWYRAERVPLAWDREHARDLFSFGRWVLGSTMVSFVAQQFHVLFLGKFLALGLLGVYQVAWNFCAQASKPITALANRVVIPHYAEFQRRSASEHGEVVRRSLPRFLPACLLACLCAGLFAPALFGLFYKASFSAGGEMGQLFAVVVWFMVLQHVPRSALLSLGASREQAGTAVANAVMTVLGVAGGFFLSGRSINGAIIGNALGNVAGCAYGAFALQRRGIRVAGQMTGYSAFFLVLLGLGVGATHLIVDQGWLRTPLASLVVTVLVAAPLSLWVWRSTRPPRPRSLAAGQEG
jgi:O-antigen/teichoic acid export membrane protein